MILKNINEYKKGSLNLLTQLILDIDIVGNESGRNYGIFQQSTEIKSNINKK